MSEASDSLRRWISTNVEDPEASTLIRLVNEMESGRAVQDGATQGLSPDDGLDVERLARALQETILTTPDEFMGPGMGAYRQPWDEMADHEQRAVIRDAEALADAYLRATPPLHEVSAAATAGIPQGDSNES